MLEDRLVEPLLRFLGCGVVVRDGVALRLAVCARLAELRPGYRTARLAVEAADVASRGATAPQIGQPRREGRRAFGLMGRGWFGRSLPSVTPKARRAQSPIEDEGGRAL